MPKPSPRSLMPLAVYEELLRKRGLDPADYVAPVVTSNRFRQFQRRYRDDLYGFVHDCIDFGGGGPAAYQDDILLAFVNNRRIAVRGPHGLGKTALASWVILWGVLTNDEIKVVTTASAWRQLIKYLWPEVHKWAARLRWDVIGRPPFDPRRELHAQSIKLGPLVEAFAAASSKPDYIEGAHAKRLIYVFDESKAIPDPVWDAAEGALMTDDAWAVAISTPGTPSGRFYDIHRKAPGTENWWTRHVTLQETIDAGRMSPDAAERYARLWGENSAVYQNRVLGEFAASEEDSVVPLWCVEAAFRRWEQQSEAGFPNLGPLTSVGADIGVTNDLSVFALRYGDVVKELRVYGKQDTMATAGRLAGLLRANPGARVVVDWLGVGTGAYDRLREQFPVSRVKSFVASERTKLTDASGEFGFVSKRAAAWWTMRELLTEPGCEIALPPDDELLIDLTTPTWRIQSGGRIKVESKDDIRKRISRSTDRGDAVVMAFFKEPSGVYFA